VPFFAFIAQGDRKGRPYNFHFSMVVPNSIPPLNGAIAT
jgi:hypothetical protein